MKPMKRKNKRYIIPIIEGTVTPRAIKIIPANTNKAFTVTLYHKEE